VYDVVGIGRHFNKM